jgi:hypothetical protein
MTLLEFLTARYDEDAELGAEAMDPQYSGGGYGLALGKMLIADIEAKRQILAAAERVDAARGPSDDDCLADDLEAQHAAFQLTLGHLASPYRDHPDWREVWRP